MEASEESLFQLSLEECRLRFSHPIQGVDVVRPCTVGDGVEQWSSDQVAKLSESWDGNMADQCGLWVPASGEATRMFSFLQTDEQAQVKLWESVDRIAFGKTWKAAVHARYGSMKTASAKEACEVLWHEVDEGRMPKGIVPFHCDGDEVENAFDAHIAMWEMLFPERGKVWFTVSDAKQHEIEKHLSGTNVHVRWHLLQQDPKTDVPILTNGGDWLTDSAGEIVRRRGGHGALLPLIQGLNVPMLVIRNIDNAPSPSLRSLRVKWTRAMLSVSQVWSEERERLCTLLKGKSVAPKSVVEWLNASGAGLDLNAKLSTSDAQAWLNRPMRLVGVVRNEGQPGGGPYWVRIHSGLDAGLIRPQIVESIEFGEQHKSVMKSATHFNPVDMVCMFRSGQQLGPYVDSSRFMMATKTVQGHLVKVLEYPGLWNGGMSGWLTRFVEIPSSCSQPVKTALDLIDRK